MKIFKSLLRTRRYKDRLKLTSNITKCDKYTTPSYLMEDGVEADLIIMVVIESGGYFMKNNIEAAALHCAQDYTTSKPVIGFIEYRANLLYEGQHSEDYLIWLSLHELSHVLVFHENLYDDFINPDNNRKLGENNVLLYRKDPDGEYTSYIQTRSVRIEAEKHFGCKCQSSNRKKINVLDDNIDEQLDSNKDNKKFNMLKSKTLEYLKKISEQIAKNSMDIDYNNGNSNDNDNSNSNDVDNNNNSKENQQKQTIKDLLYDYTDILNLQKIYKDYTISPYSMFHNINTRSYRINSTFTNTTQNITNRLFTILKFKVSSTILKNIEVNKNKSSNCIYGVPLESEGGSGLAGAHWSRKAMNTDYMIGRSHGENLISRITLALFNDSGWYKVDLNKANIFQWGKNTGCDFLQYKTRCLDSNYINISQNSFNVKSHFKKEICDSINNPTCSRHYMFRGFCGVRKYYKTFTENNKHFSDPHVGGADFLINYCPIVVEEKYGQNYYGGSCKVGEKSSLENFESISNSSACFVTNLKSRDFYNAKRMYQPFKSPHKKYAKASCLEFKCKGSSLYVVIGN